MWCGMICWKWSRLTPYMGSNERSGLCPELSRVDVLNEPLIIAVVVRPIRWVRIVLARSSLSQLVLVGPDGPDHRIVSVPAPTGFVRPGWAGSSYRQLASCLEHFCTSLLPEPHRVPCRGDVAAPAHSFAGAHACVRHSTVVGRWAHRLRRLVGCTPGLCGHQCLERGAVAIVA
jgi:hypothetical protein